VTRDEETQIQIHTGTHSQTPPAEETVVYEKLAHGREATDLIKKVLYLDRLESHSREERTRQERPRERGYRGCGRLERRRTMSGEREETTNESERREETAERQTKGGTGAQGRVSVIGDGREEGEEKRRGRGGDSE
jgi:hypothetical protein